MSTSVSGDARFRLAVFAGLSVYCFVVSKVIGLRPDHVFLSLLILVFLFFGRNWGRLFLVDFSPFVLFWVAYDMMRGVADSVRGRINIDGPFELETLMFGWMTPSDVPAFYFQQFQSVFEGTLLKAALDVGSALLYTLHFVTPLLTGWFLWHTLNERRSFYLFAYAFTILNVMALVTFMVYPAAPPWYVFLHGFGQPGHFMLGSAGGLVNFDKLIGADVFASIYDTFNANLFAAIPSLHAGYPTLIALVIWQRFRGAAWLWGLYPLVAWFSAVYLNHHYVIDLVIGSCYAVIAFFITRAIALPFIFDRFVDYDRTSRMLLGRRRA